jgi:hypothetical protein
MFFKWWYFLFIILFFGNITSCNTNEIRQGNYRELNLIKKRIEETNYYISLPENWYIDKNLGPDFIVYYFCSKEDDLEEKTHGGLYFGNWPSRFTEDDERSFEYKNYIYSRILNKNIKWKIYYTENHYFSENIIRNNGGDDWERYLHIWASGNTTDDVQKTIYLYSTITK